MALGSFCKPLPEQAVHCTTLCLHQPQQTHHTKKKPAFPEGPTRPSAHEGALPPGRKVWDSVPTSPRPRTGASSPRPGEAWHTQHTVGTQPILTNSSLPRFHVTNPTLTLAAHRHPQAEGSLPRGPWTPPTAAGEPWGCTCRQCGPRKLTRQAAPSHPVVALIC